MTEIIFDEKLKNEISPRGEAVRLYLELTTPIFVRKTLSNISADDRTFTDVEIPNPNYVGDIQNMTLDELKKLDLKSMAQKEFIQRYIDLKFKDAKYDSQDYLGEAGLDVKQRTLKIKTTFREISNEKI